MFKRKIAVLVMVIMGMSVLLGGCSSGGAGNGQKPSEGPETTEQGAPEEITLEEDDFIKSIKERGKLIVGCKMDVPGLGLYDEETDSWSGLEVELAYKTAGQIFGVSPDEAKERNLVEIKGVTVADREETLEKGDIDCMIATYTITKERGERFTLSNSYYTDYVGLMVRYTGGDKDLDSLGSGDIRSIADLDGKYVGVPRNATTREDFLNYINTMNTIKVSPIFCEYESYDQLFKALKDGNIDVMSVDVSILNGYVDKSTKILDARFAGQHYGAAVRNENANLINYINKAIAE
ncbi:MAG: transporter substrate-binding domain-containing protein [Eubacterium sp.]|nr:transporter substrate-binding domain-containing protein [Eubacterium sp.]